MSRASMKTACWLTKGNGEGCTVVPVCFLLLNAETVVTVRAGDAGGFALQSPGQDQLS